MVRLLVVLSVLLVPRVALAADDSPPPVIDVPPGDDVIVVVVKGKPAPFTGQLFDQSTALRWTNWLVQYRHRLKADVDLERKKCGHQLGYEQKLREIEAERNEKVEKDLRERLKASEQRGANVSNELANPSFFKSLEFGLILGAVVTAAGAVAVALATGS